MVLVENPVARVDPQTVQVAAEYSNQRFRLENGRAAIAQLKDKIAGWYLACGTSVGGLAGGIVGAQLAARGSDPQAIAWIVGILSTGVAIRSYREARTNTFRRELVKTGIPVQEALRDEKAAELAHALDGVGVGAGADKEATAKMFAQSDPPALRDIVTTFMDRTAEFLDPDQSVELRLGPRPAHRGVRQQIWDDACVAALLDELDGSSPSGLQGASLRASGRLLASVNESRELG